MWREFLVPKLLGLRGPAYVRKGQWAVVDAQGQRSTISSPWTVNDWWPMVNVHFVILAFEVMSGFFFF